MRSKVTIRKVGVELKRRREPSKRRLGWRLAWWGSTEKKDTSHLLGLRGRHQYSEISAPIETELLVWPSPQWGPRTKWLHCQRKDQLTEEGRNAGRSLIPSQERILVEHLDGLERNDFCEYEKSCKRAYQKGKIESHKQSKEGGQPK